MHYLSCHSPKLAGLAPARAATMNPDTPTGQSTRERRPSVSLQPMGKYVPRERPSGRADRSAQSSSATPATPTPGVNYLESVRSGEEDAQAEQVAWADGVSIAGGDGSRHSAQWESVTKRAVLSLVDSGAQRRRKWEDPFLERTGSHMLHGEVCTDTCREVRQRDLLVGCP